MREVYTLRLQDKQQSEAKWAGAVQEQYVKMNIRQWKAERKYIKQHSLFVLFLDALSIVKFVDWVLLLVNMLTEDSKRKRKIAPKEKRNLASIVCVW